MTVAIAILAVCALATIYLARHPNRIALMLVVAAAAGSIAYALA